MANTLTRRFRAAFHHNQNEDVLVTEKRKRKHVILPFIDFPHIQGLNTDKPVFAQRHEAATVELFFDLFFVANLATFTAYHSITSNSSLIAYIGFFAILWSTWFQITMFDCRFARDSVYERGCKIVQFVVFVGFALVGSSFEPGGSMASNSNFTVLCWTLFISRVLFTVQYSVILFFCWKQNLNKLYLPLALNILVFIAAAVVFAGITPIFTGKKSHPGTYAAWWIVMAFEGLATIAISSNWRMLSFKKTHIVERMGLLTLIVIGEGAIGVTKTISRMMGKYGPDGEGCAMVLCIILILAFLWMVYFDNHPHGHYGTIRQQIWCALHFPFQLAIVGLVEGSQQVALARYVSIQDEKLRKYFEKYCFQEQLDGAKLVSKFRTAISYWQLYSKTDSLPEYENIQYDLNMLRNATGVCSTANLQKYANNETTLNMPPQILSLYWNTLGGIYASLGVKMPKDATDATVIMFDAWWTVYKYYWVAAMVLFACLLVFLVLIRKNKSDLFDWLSLGARLGAFVVALGLFIAGEVNDTFYSDYITSPGMVPTVTVLLFLVLIIDQLGRIIANRRLKKSGAAYDDPHDAEGHGHDEHDGHETKHMSTSSSDVEKGPHGSVAEVTPLTQDAEYRGNGMQHTTSHTGYHPVGHVMPDGVEMGAGQNRG